MSGADQIDDSSAPLVEHLAELRTRVIYSLLAFVIAFGLCFWVWNDIFNFLTIPMCEALEGRGQSCQLILVKAQEGFFVAIKIAMFAGFALSFPLIGYQLWRFVAPGLYRSEKTAFLPFLVASPVMFFIGAAFCYYIILPFAFDFFLGFQQRMAANGEEATGLAAAIVFQGSMEQYLSLTTSFVLAFGLCFQLPVLLTLMGRAGLITATGLAGMRKYAIVLILALAAIVTPPDPASQVILFSAIYPLYEVSIFLIRRFEREKDRKAREEGIIGEGESLFDPAADEPEAEAGKP